MHLMRNKKKFRNFFVIAFLIMIILAVGNTATAQEINKSEVLDKNKKLRVLDWVISMDKVKEDKLQEEIVEEETIESVIKNSKNPIIVKERERVKLRSAQVMRKSEKRIELRQNYIPTAPHQT